MIDDFAKQITPQNMRAAQISIEEFIALYNEKQCEFVDIRVAFETAIWQMNFGLQIPGDELPNRLNELPKDKLIVVSCPKMGRAIMARSYLVAKGFEVKYLNGGLISLIDRLKGGKAKDLVL